MNAKITKDLIEVKTIREDGYEDVAHFTREEIEHKTAELLPQKEHLEGHLKDVNDELVLWDARLAELNK